MKNIRYLLLILLTATSVCSLAQKRDINLTINVKCVTGESLYGQEINVMNTDYSVNYEKIYLDNEGHASIKIFSGNSRVVIQRSGYKIFTEDFNATADIVLNAELEEDVQTPFSLATDIRHDVFTGNNDVIFSWNKEAPVFFDNFEEYDPFSVKFGEWTGIDGDCVAAAPLTGDYPNRSALMYAQIINPMEVVPSWWTDFPVLRPFSGRQYAGFIRTTDGRANDDWLISPKITLGNMNSLTFMAKAGDVGKERFQVYLTEKTDNPEEKDFVKINSGNYESVEFSQWREFVYDLSAYAGKDVKIAIRYISEANTEKTFMLMIDDVAVGQKLAKTTVKRVNSGVALSPQNPNESFKVYLDGDEQGTTDDYEYIFRNITEGKHSMSVKAFYRQAESDIVHTEVTVSNAETAVCTVNVTANNGASLDGQTITITDMDRGQEYVGTVCDGLLRLMSLPYGRYMITADIGGYHPLNRTVDVRNDIEISMELEEIIVTPYNVTADITAAAQGFYTVSLHWNQDMAFTDSFESYSDFAQNTFGDWKSIDNDGGAVYPIALGSQSNIITFPGASTPQNPTAIAPIVFNAYTTTPAMLPDDPAMTPLTGSKQVLFFSPQGKKADKWLVSPQTDIRNDYVLRVAVKAYSDMFPESMELCISTTDGSAYSFTVLREIEEIGAERWTVYEADLSSYAGQKAYLGVHYTTYDGFFTQLDDFYVGSADGKGETLDVGAVKSYEILLDGVEEGMSAVPEYTIYNVPEGLHKVGIRANYASGTSETTVYEFNTSATSIGDVISEEDSSTAEFFTIDGRKIVMCEPGKGVYIRKTAKSTMKVILK